MQLLGVQLALPQTGQDDRPWGRAAPEEAEKAERRRRKKCESQRRYRLKKRVAVAPEQATIFEHLSRAKTGRYRRPAIRASRNLTRAEAAFKRELDVGPPLPRRPRSYELCLAAGLGIDLPCPFASCRYNLTIEVMGKGALRVIYPFWEPGEAMDKPTCALAEADKGEHTAAEMGEILAIGIDRIGQIGSEAEAKFAARIGTPPTKP